MVKQSHKCDELLTDLIVEKVESTCQIMLPINDDIDDQMMKCVLAKKSQNSQYNMTGKQVIWGEDDHRRQGARVTIFW